MLCDLDPKVEVIGKKAGICDGVPSTAALVMFVIRAGIHKMHLRIADKEDPDQTASSEAV